MQHSIFRTENCWILLSMFIKKVLIYNSYQSLTLFEKITSIISVILKNFDKYTYYEMCRNICKPVSALFRYQYTKVVFIFIGRWVSWGGILPPHPLACLGVPFLYVLALILGYASWSQRVGIGVREVRTHAAKHLHHFEYIDVTTRFRARFFDREWEKSENEWERTKWVTRSFRRLRNRESMILCPRFVGHVHRTLQSWAKVYLNKNLKWRTKDK